MSRKFLTNIDLSQNQLENARIQNSTTAPSSPLAGQVWYDNNSGVNRLKVWNGTTWISLLSDQSGLNSLGTNGGDYAMAGFKLTGLGTPSANDDAANKSYVDSSVSAAKQGLDVKDSVVYATISGENVNVDTLVAVTIDGTSRTLTDGQSIRVLLKNQTTGSQNGIYTYSRTGTTYSLARATDANTSTKLGPNSFVFVEAGSTNQDTGWVITNDSVTLDTTAITFTQFTGAGALTIGYGLDKTGNTLNLVTANSNRISIGPTGIDLGQPTITASSTPGTGIVQDITVDVWGRISAYSEVTRKYASNNLSTITPSSLLATWTVTHNLGTSDVIVAVYEVSTNKQIEVDVALTSTSVVTLTWNTLNNNTIPTNTYKVVVLS